ncbi:MAG: L-threonylcarbamoyladenylate synthase [Eggerthellaceae bacterium]|jgi:L-threonylcarbamoyladenylate synthase|nr:L-threonylcarbamoyladenylate synthase [Eggerthellaceae bacterium]MDR2721813.1 threonylcarbamoyl-AMP synthase [Coriobacteriaceae bacterium]
MNALTDTHITSALNSLLAGSPVIFPTDTVYGIGVAVGKAKTPQILYDIKGRDHGSPIAWLVGNVDDLTRYGQTPPPFALTLARAFWPGPLTLVVKAASSVPEAFCAPDHTIALRMPDDEVALELIRRVGSPLATSSANVSGQEPPKAFENISQELLARLKACEGTCLNDSLTKSGIASTVIDCTGTSPAMIRAGTLSMNDIAHVLV